MKTVQIPETLFKKLQKELLNSGLSSVEDLTAYILQQYLDGQEETADASGQKIIEERLRNLGYL